MLANVEDSTLFTYPGPSPLLVFADAVAATLSTRVPLHILFAETAVFTLFTLTLLSPVLADGVAATWFLREKKQLIFTDLKERIPAQRASSKATRLFLTM